MKYRNAFIDWYIEICPVGSTRETPTREQAFEAGVNHGIALFKPDNTPKEHIVDL